MTYPGVGALAALRVVLVIGSPQRKLLLQGTADNRVRVRLESQNFRPAGHNQEAEIQSGLPLRRYGSRARAV